MTGPGVRKFSFKAAQMSRVWTGFNKRWLGFICCLPRNLIIYEVPQPGARSSGSPNGVASVYKNSKTPDEL